MNRFLIALFFCVGVLFRLRLTNLVPQPFVYDQMQYRDFAAHMIEKGFHADTYRLYGFPFLMTPFVFVSDVSVNKLPWMLFQSVLDTCSAFLIFSIARRIFQNVRYAWIAFILYLFNPFTSAYVGVFLSEIVSIFLITLLFFLILQWIYKKSFRLSLILALLLGFLPQVRPVFLYFDVFLIVLMLKSYIRDVQKTSVIIFFFILPFSYTLLSNKVFFDEATPFSVDNVLVREIYTSLFIERSLPTGTFPYYAWHPEVLHTWGTYASWIKEKRLENTKLYKAKARKIISQDPSAFFLSRIRKMWYVWEKHYLFAYVLESRDPLINGAVYWGNIVFLVLGLGGLLQYIKSNQNSSHKTYAFIVLSFFMYMTFVHVFSTSEERYTLPAYPLIFLFAGWSLISLQRFLTSRKKTSIKEVELV